MEDENLPATKKDVWLAWREIEILLEQMSEQVSEMQAELTKVRNLLNPPIVIKPRP